MPHLPYNRKLKDKSRQLRNDSTLSEVLLWQELRAKQMRGYQFNRQKPLLHYIVDFYSHRLKLIIEIDGRSHESAEAVSYDEKRQKDLEALGLYFLRFDDRDVKDNISSILRTIEGYIEDFERGKY